MLNRYSLMIGILWVVLEFLRPVPVAAFPRLDASFGLNGRVAVELGANNNGHAVLVQPDGKIVAAGSSSQSNALNFSLLRFNPNGSPDTSFNKDGSVLTSLSAGDDEALALGLLSDGRIVAAGYAHNGRDRDLAMICYRPDGTLDKQFGDGGVVLTSIGNANEEIVALTVSHADMITVVGSTEGTAGRILVAARYDANGEPDTGFGEQGISLIAVGEDASAEGIVEREDGTFVISGSYGEKKKSAAMLVGLNRDGMVDTAFGERGVAIPAGNFAASEGYGLAVDGSGLIYVAGSVGLPGKRETALFRFTRQGKADAAFGDRGVVVAKISAEDDVLYDVDIGKGGVAASGFTTDAGTRQFLLLSYAPDGFAAAGTVSERQPTNDVAENATELAPVQEVRVNGNTRVQIRRLQMWSSGIQIRELQVMDSWSGSAFLSPTTVPIGGEASHIGGTVFPAEPARSVAASPFDRFLAGSGDRLAAFFLPEALAAEGSLSAPSGYGSTYSPQIATTTFSEGESVSFALTSDEQGNLIVVGTADGNGASSIAAARFLAEDMVDRITDRPGHRSSHIATGTPAEITRTTITVSGEIAPAFDKEVVRRGVVFSIHPGPLYPGKNLADVWNPWPLPERALDALATFFLPEALAANSAPLRPMPAVGGQTGASSSQALETGEAVGGKGMGGFVAVLDRLRPGTVYYIRAYVLTAKGEVYYGNQISARTADACFVATASFGTLFHPSVGVLRDFRDAFLVRNTVGKRLVDLYYTLSPPLADIVAQSGMLRGAVRMLLLPCVGFSWLALQTGLGVALGMVAVAMALAGWLVRMKPR